MFLKLRLPRVILAGMTGAVLGVSGTLMQGLFRNPIVEPGLAGTSAGAALGAALVFVFGERTTLAFTAPLGSFAVPVLAFAGGFAATMLVYRLSSSFGKVDVFTLLLAGHRRERGMQRGHGIPVVRRARSAGAEHHLLEPRHVHDGRMARRDARRRLLRARLRLVHALWQSAQRAHARRNGGDVSWESTRGA